MLYILYNLLSEICKIVSNEIFFFFYFIVDYKRESRKCRFQ